MSPKGRGQYAIYLPTMQNTTLLPALMYKRAQVNVPVRTSRQMKEEEPS
jgi:hypothetical protein